MAWLQRLAAFFNRFDWVLFCCTILLVIVGLAALYSIGLGQPTQEFSAFSRQLIFAILGVGGLFVMTVMDYRALSKSYVWLYVAGVVLLILVLLFGVTIRGTKGWFAIGGLQAQPVELAKMFLAVTLSAFFAAKSREMIYLRNVLVSAAIMGVFFILVVLQPDTGSAMVMLGMWALGLLLTRYKGSHLALLVGVGAVMIAASWFFILADYQKDRVLTFLNPASDPYGSGYNVTQSVIAVGAGQLVGRGLGFGSQSQLKFIPESQTDFIFAVIAEELGFVGVVLVLALYAIVIYRCVRVAIYASDDFAQYLAMFVAIIFFIHITVNIGMNMGLLPVTGISLPLISAGGSFLIVSLALVGIVESIAMRGALHRAS